PHDSLAPSAHGPLPSASQIRSDLARRIFRGALQSNVPQPSASVRRPRLQTRLGPDKLERRLTKIFREERTLEEEQGLSTLFLALGFLKWFDSDQAEESFAPLVLVPVTMIRVSGGDGYLLRGRDDE